MWHHNRASLNAEMRCETEIVPDGKRAENPPVVRTVGAKGTAVFVAGKSCFRLAPPLRKKLLGRRPKYSSSPKQSVSAPCVLRSSTLVVGVCLSCSGCLDIVRTVTLSGCLGCL